MIFSLGLYHLYVVVAKCINFFFCTQILFGFVLHIQAYNVKNIYYVIVITVMFLLLYASIVYAPNISTTSSESPCTLHFFTTEWLLHVPFFSVKYVKYVSLNFPDISLRKKQ